MSSHLRLGKKSLSGFTLIELLVVVVIIGLLSALATTSYLKAQSTARDNARKTDISAISAALETFYTTNKKFPGYITKADTGGTATTYAGCQSVGADNSTYFYYYKPSTVCDQEATTPSKTYYKTADYVPNPTWIPGLSSFINPMPIEKRYQGTDGGNSSNITTGLLSARDTGTNQARSYVYQHINGGYLLQARLENASTGENYYNGNSSASGQPQLTCNGTTYNYNTQNLYAICK